mgnify:CR=1 FL=1
MRKYIIITVVLSFFVFLFSNYLNAADNLTINIEQKEEFLDIGNKYVNPREGNKYIAFLVVIENSSKLVIWGGTCDYSHIFEATTDDDYVIKAENTASEAWRKNRSVWCVSEIPPGETRKGWVVFSIPMRAYIKNITFEVDEIIGPSQTRQRGKLKISP